MCFVTFEKAFDLGQQIFSLLLQNVSQCQNINVNSMSINLDIDTHLTLLHLNTRSLQKHIDDLRDFLYQTTYFLHL